MRVGDASRTRESLESVELNPPRPPACRPEGSADAYPRAPPRPSASASPRPAAGLPTAASRKAGKEATPHPNALGEVRPESITTAPPPNKTSRSRLKSRGRRYRRDSSTGPWRRRSATSPQGPVDGVSRGPPLSEGELVSGPTLLLSDGDLRPELVAQMPWDDRPSAISVHAPAIP